MIYKKDNAIEIEKQGVKMRIYKNKEQWADASVVY